MSYSIRKNFLFSKLSISIQRNNARSILNKQQQLKDFNFSYRNDNFNFNNLVNTPIKSNIKKSVVPKNMSSINIANNIRNFLVPNNSLLKTRPKRSIINPVDSFIEKFIKL